MAMRWYIVHAYSNFERKVAESIKERAAAAGLGEQIQEVLVPMEEVVEMRRGRKVASERKFFPGYVLVKMELNDQTYHLIKSTPKVTGFLGTENKPIAISEEEAGRIACIRAYAFCPEVMREIGEALGLHVRTGLYRFPTPAPGKTY